MKTVDRVCMGLILCAMIECCIKLNVIADAFEVAVNQPVAISDNMREYNPNDKNDGLVMLYNAETGECKVCKVNK